MSRKQFGANGVGLRVKRKIDVFMYNISYTKLAVTFPQNFEKVISLCFAVAMLCFKVFSDG